MKINDVTKMENFNTFLMAIESHENNFNTEDKMATDLMEKIRKVVVDTGLDMSEEAPGERLYTGIKNDIEDLLNAVGMNYYVRGMRASARLLDLLYVTPEDE